MSSIFGSSKDDQQHAASPGELTQQQQQQKTAAVSSEIPTGIPGFDDLLGQGLPVGNLYLLSGSFSSNAALFAQQVLYNILLRKGKVAYYTVEKQSTDIIDDMRIYGMNVENYVDDGSWVFARIVSPSLKKISEALPEVPMEQRIDVSTSLAPFMDHFLAAVKEGRSTAIHLTPLVRSFGIDDIQSTLLYMTAVARKYGGIHFVLLTDGIVEQNVTVAIKDLVDAVYEMVTETRGSEIETIVMIQKIRKVLPRTRVIRLAVRKDGFATETIRRIG